MSKDTLLAEKTRRPMMPVVTALGVLRDLRNQLSRNP